MSIDFIREYCLSLPHATESLQWGDNLVMKVGGKMFAIIVLEPRSTWMAFKCTAEDFAELVERPDIVPSPYLARYHWVALQTKDALTVTELKEQVRRSYELVLEGLPKKSRAALVTSQKKLRSRAMTK